MKGIAALLTIITITLFLVSVGYLIISRSDSSVSTGKYEAEATKAQFLADTGIQDGLMKLVRNKNYTGTYTLSDEGWTIEIGVLSSSTIIATSSVSTTDVTIGRTIKATISLDGDGKIVGITKENL